MFSTDKSGGEVSQKRTGYCWSTQSAENWASHIPLWKAQEHGESEAAPATVSRGNRLTNSIRRFCETVILQLALIWRSCHTVPVVDFPPHCSSTITEVSAQPPFSLKNC